MKIEDILGLAVPATYLFMYVTEKIWPARQFPKIGWWGLVGVGFMLLMMTFGVVLPLVLPVEWIANHRLMNGEWLGVAGGVVVGFTVFQLVVYAYHRACHSVPFMWRAFHQMHHAPQRIDIPGAVVFHPLELVMQNVIGIGVTVFVLGLDPLAAAIIGYIGAFYGLFQHWNIRTPSWLGYVIQRPESHCHHHELNVHAYNYADLPIWDIVFGTFRNPDKFEGKVGFAEKASFSKMLVGIDVNEGQDAGQPGGKLAPMMAQAQ
jgi:sterol desaturase/sphingolipid hydroxylase (fatty acid hydroxylase superfamily)